MMPLKRWSIGEEWWYLVDSDVDKDSTNTAGSYRRLVPAEPTRGCVAPWRGRSRRGTGTTAPDRPSAGGSCAWRSAQTSVSSPVETSYRDEMRVAEGT